jgi:hypothetical protein
MHPLSQSGRDPDEAWLSLRGTLETCLVPRCIPNTSDVDLTSSLAFAVTSDNASRPYGDMNVLQPIMWSSTWRAPWMPTCVITFRLVADSVTAQSERRSSLRCLVTARGGS